MIEVGLIILAAGLAVSFLILGFDDLVWRWRNRRSRRGGFLQ